MHPSENQTSAFFDPFTRVPWKRFCNAEKRAKITAKGKIKDVAVQRDIFGLLMAVSSKEGAVVNLDKALSYALSTVPLALATSDGIRRKTSKSKLMDATFSSVGTDNVNTDHSTCLVIDLIATIRCIAKVPNTFGELAFQLLHQIKSMYQTVYAACDTYLQRSIKSSEREIRGQAETLVIRSPNIRIPPDFNNFLNNGTNKERLLELIEDVWKGEAAALGNRVLYFARQCTCVRLTSQRVETIEELQINHEEADTKICYLLHHAVQSNNNEETVCVVRSSSCDIDIPVILLANEMLCLLAYVYNGAGKNRKVMDLSSCSLSKYQKRALLGMHAFTGNDYVSSFLRKGKQVCRKLIKDSAEFLQMFGELGSQDYVSESTAAGLEKFVCSLYSEKVCHL